MKKGDKTMHDQDQISLPEFVRHYKGITRKQLNDILRKFTKLKVGVIGDGCLDVYWHADMTLSELSRETPNHPLPIVEEYYTPGAAGNVAANLKALGVGQVYFCSITGKDWRSSLLRQLFKERHIDDSYFISHDQWTTPAYCKPIRHGIHDIYQEDPRIDFDNRNPLPAEAVEHLMRSLDEMAKRVDLIAVTDQLNFGVIGPLIRKRLHRWSQQGKIIVADSRDRIGLFSGVIVKPNEVETLRWYRPDADPRKASWRDWLEAGKMLVKNAGAPCCMTLGEKGSLWIDTENYIYVPAVSVESPIDIVGAGDCFVSAFLTTLGTGCSPAEAMTVAHLAASVVIRKLGTTGTASPQEILQKYNEIQLNRT